MSALERVTMGAVRSAVRGARGASAALRNPLFVPPGHFYSPIPAQADLLRAAETARGRTDLPGIDLRAQQQRDLVAKLAPCWADVPTSRRDDWRYYADNPMFGLADAAVYYSMFRELKPSRVIEVGSGFSSAIGLDAADRFAPDTSFTFVEPYPDRLLGILRPADQQRCELIRHGVQEVPLSTFDQLRSGDLLFIDSTHVSKAGSDVNYLFFEVLPRLADGVVIHVHDIFWPFEYPAEWLREGRNWTENYLLRAFLTHNTAFEILLFNSWFWETENASVRAALPQAADLLPGSIWLRKVG
ncbi:class I SAM-dependent methyltransferase [Kutzneria chonburiensis]|uniref:Class I SAM-dependent methyltransferase n=1 Tax=Kutzneria chonburiensis TaxID=1483604 RepID=A0ABV6N178_9PSEU|nr:class I SAM-dependent methyltransferase [Kutzneria chonburiensis]